MPSQHIIPDASTLDVAGQKSSSSGGDGDCVEFAAYEGGIAIRHSKAPNGPALLYTRSEIAAMIEGVKAGEFDHLANGLGRTSG
ncbi:regulator [Streptomyces yokosukanensis]|uniref:Regulator n=1 Tax=Streptomyces yokosukanensis TaxID=67386 RepID=A0A101P9T8_9ACTN|nr:DUF397 domain-containing protein [Streptomyces yokosukanensis]KUN07546.1 regulator [Streptomyces yokosukanensis]